MTFTYKHNNAYNNNNTFLNNRFANNTFSKPQPVLPLNKAKSRLRSLIEVITFHTTYLSAYIYLFF